MAKAMIWASALVLGCGALGACAVLPSSGPSASTMVRQAVHIETVSPADAVARWNRQAAAATQRTSDVLSALAQDTQQTPPVQLYPGARLNVTLWTEPEFSSIASGDTTAPGATMKTDLGLFSVDDAGNLTLPYLAPVQVSGRNLEQVRQLLDERIAATRRFQAPQLTLTIQANARQQIIVAGAANHPAMVDWRDGGVGLSEAITLAGGSVLYQQDKEHALTANHVVIVRTGSRYDLPLKTALESNVQLRPNDQVVLEYQAAVKVQCLGGGWPQNTVQSFDEVPSLSRVVATGGGLSTQQAQGRSVFVLSADRQMIYKFDWNTLAGLQAAQTFPLQDGDIVYVATAPIIRIQQVTNILFSAAYPVATAKSIN